ncbi:MAG: hypothetical protein LBS19_11720 [Clostridiales bacterium]|jgi:hypothetical protein|nr:hypothetical protein [Clostridiales bacterium]
MYEDSAFEPVSSPGCDGFISADDGRTHLPVYNESHPDCASCVYFSNRNCGRDSGPDGFVFDRQLI